MERQTVHVSPTPAPDPCEGTAADAWESARIREVQQGRPQSFNPIVVHYAPRIRAYLYRMVRNHEEAEDLTQETFLNAFRALPRFEANRPFKRWLFTIATNAGLNALRARDRRGAQVDIDTDSLPPGAHAGGVSETHRKNDAEALENAIARLPERAAQLIALHYHEGFSLQEAGEMLKMTEGAAKVALCRARRELRKRMARGEEDGL